MNPSAIMNQEANSDNNAVADGRPLDVQWHPLLHEKWAKEQLLFMRLGFAPTYQRDRIRDALMTVFAEHQVRSYVGYELLGVYDVILRLWLPSTTTPQAFFESMRRSLKAVDMTTSDSFSVLRQARNWLWEENGSKALVTPDTQRVANGPPSPNEMHALETDPSIFATFRSANLIRPIERHEGVKFFMVLPAHSNLPDSSREEIDREVSEALDALELDEYSLYIGQGFGSGAAVIMARIAFDRFYDIGNVLGARILGRLMKVLGVRTYTFPTSNDKFLCYSECVPGMDLATVPPDSYGTLEVLLDAGETRWCEIKGSAFVPLVPLFDHNKRIDSPNTDATRGLLNAVTGLLNAGGGTVVLGVIEKGRYAEPTVRQHFGDYPEHGRYLCLGVDDEINDDADKFEQRIRETLASHISPAPTGSVDVEFHTMGERTFVLLRVRASPTSWYYLDGTGFPVRDGNKTDSLEGHLGDLYREANPRGKGGSV
jgi:hypothetical protein